MFKNNIDTKDIINNIHKISIKYNQDKLYLIKSFLNYLIRNKDLKNINSFLNDIELLIHNNKSSIENQVIYFINVMKNYYK